jgi:hypothetical protein
MAWRRKKQEQEKDLHSPKYRQRVVKMKKKALLRFQEEIEAEEQISSLEKNANPDGT